MRALGLKILLFSLVCLLTAATQAQIYKIVHPDGRVEYTDEPPMDQELQPVELPALILQPGVPLPPADSRASETSPAAASGAAQARLTLLNPQDETVVHGTGRTVEFSLSAENAPEGSQFQLVHNGAAALTIDQSSFNSPQLLPGTQTFRVNLLSAEGDSITSTAPIRIYVIP